MSFFSFGIFSVIIFFLISVYILSLALCLLAFENPVYAIFLLVLIFFGSSFLLIELNLFFLALMILIVYLGALIVLFLFVVMMLNIKSLELNRVINFFPFVFIFISALFLFFLSGDIVFFLEDSNMFLFYFSFFDWSHLYFFLGPFLSLGFSLYTFNFILLILISFVLLLAMFGAIILTLVPSRYFFKQNSTSQILQLRYLENVKV